MYLIAYPKPSIYWTFTERSTGQNKSVAFNNSFGVFEHQSNLQKLESEEHDFGVYTVHAKNTIGDEYIRHFTVSAQSKYLVKASYFLLLTFVNTETINLISTASYINYSAIRLTTHKNV